MTTPANQSMGQLRTYAGALLMLAVVASSVLAPFGNTAFADLGDPRIVTASAGANGTISPDGAYPATEGDVITFTITPDGGYNVADVLVDGMSVGAVSSYDLTVTGDNTIDASFTAAPPAADTTAPNAPTLTSPTDGEVLTSAALTLLDWSDETDPSSPVTYIYQASNVSADVDGNGDFVSVLYTSGNLTDSEIPTGVNPEGTYYWHVKSVDDEGNESDWSTTSTFTVDNSATWYVDAANMGMEDGSESAPFNTIGEAVDAAIDGDTVRVAAGTYAEQVLANKELAFKGAQYGNDARDRSGDESTVDGGGAMTPFVVTSSNVTIDGFTIIRGAGGYASGVYSVIGNENFVVRNNIIRGNQIGLYAECGVGCLIENNLFDGTDAIAGSAGGAGIYTEKSTGLTVRDNSFVNHAFNSAVIFASVAGPTHFDVAFSGNDISGGAEDNSAVYVTGVDGGEFSSNTITAPESGATALSLSGGNNDISVTENTITNSNRGVRVIDHGYGANTNITVSENRLSGNVQYGLGFTDAGTVDAVMNWWGSHTGPTIASNVGGLGDALVEGVDGSVSYSPWCTNVDCVVDTTAPEVDLEGPHTIEVFLGDVFTDPGATATDNYDSSVSVVVTGTVDTSVVGSYVLTYSATDTAGNTGSDDRTVEVIAHHGGGGGGGSNNNGGGSSNNNSGNDNNGGGEVLGAATYSFGADLTIGSTGNDVIELQKILIALGYLKIDAPTGYFGPLTQAAVKLFQAAHGVPATGFVGPLTRAALNALAVTPDATKLAELQAQLEALLKLLEESKKGN